MPGRGLHHPRHRHGRHLLVAVAAALVVVAPGGAAWSAGGAGGGVVQAKVMPTGNTPSASVPLLSFNVTVSWSASTFSGGGSVSGYVVKRYPAAGGAAVAPAAACSGTVSGTSCTENSVPLGSWRYSVTPVAGGWSGTESAQSAAVNVPGGT